MELFASVSLGRPSVVWKVEQDIEVKRSTFWVENSTQLWLEIWPIFFVAESELAERSLGRLRVSFSSSSEDAAPIGPKGQPAPAVLSLSLKKTEDCWWDKVQNEGPASTGGKTGTDFSGDAESGDDTDKAEKEDVPSEVVDTKMYKGERLCKYKWE